jgi:hypothetical protein
MITPKDLKELTQVQITEMIKYLSKKSLTELRKKQKLIENQITIAFNQNNTLALDNLNIMQDILIQAVILKEF